MEEEIESGKLGKSEKVERGGVENGRDDNNHDEMQDCNAKKRTTKRREGRGGGEEGNVCAGVLGYIYIYIEVVSSK
jgi:hypothetical protein